MQKNSLREEEQGEIDKKECEIKKALIRNSICMIVDVGARQQYNIIRKSLNILRNLKSTH
jgi:hypothetical protein